MHRVGKSLTHNQPDSSFGSTSLGHINFGSISIGFGFAIVEQNLAEFWLKYCQISSDLVGANEIWPIFPYIYKYRAKILMDMAEIYLSDRLKGSNLPILAEFVISSEGRTAHRAGWVRRFLRQPTRNWNQRSWVLVLATRVRPWPSFGWAVSGENDQVLGSLVGSGGSWTALIISIIHFTFLLRPHFETSTI